jgi:hypothetical protein
MIKNYKKYEDEPGEEETPEVKSDYFMELLAEEVTDLTIKYAQYCEWSTKTTEVPLFATIETIIRDPE